MIWGGMLFSLGVYAGVLIAVPRPDAMPWEELQTMLIALSAVAVAEIPMIIFLRKMFFFVRLVDGDFDDEEELEAGYFTTSIISWALAESIAIYGFVLAFMGGMIDLYYPFAVTSTALLLLFRYQPDAQIEAFRGSEDGSHDTDDQSIESDQTW